MIINNIKNTSTNKSLLLADNRKSPIIAEGRNAFLKFGFSEDDIEYYADRMIAVLDDYAAFLGENTEIEYAIRKKPGRLEVTVYIPGENYDPFENGKDAKRRKAERIFHLNLNSQEACISHTYIGGRNIVTEVAVLDKKSRSMLKDPIIWAIILGVIVGLICLHLPENIKQFILNDILDPVYSILLKVLAGIMGPVIFISLLTSIIALDSVNDLTHLGLKIFRRFINVILFVVLLSMGVSFFFFNSFGKGGIDFSPQQIVTLLLDIIPFNLISPFLNNNMPQIVILAFVSGIALLLLGDRMRNIKTILHQCNDWVMKVMSLVNKFLPLVPFLSIASIIGKGNAAVFVDGWKFIVASYIVFTLCLVLKALKTRFITKVPIREVLKRSWPAIRTGFSTTAASASLNHMYEASKELHIRPEFTSFWIPMSAAMMSLKTTVNVVIATIMMTELLNLPISFSFLFVLILLATEMTLASPGTTGSWVIAFETFSMPVDYVGLFTTYRVFTLNYATGVTIAYHMFEQVEAAYKMNAIDKETDSAS